MAIPSILFLDQSGQLGGGELCLGDLAEFCRGRCGGPLFQDGPCAELLRAKRIPVIVAALPQTAGRVGKASGAFAYLRAIPGMALLIYRVTKLANDFELLYANTAKARSEE